MEPIELTVEKLKTSEGVSALNQMLRTIFDNLPGDTLTVRDLSGYGTPEGVVTASIGSTYRRINGGTSTAFYVKETGVNTNSGWVAK